MNVNSLFVAESTAGDSTGGAEESLMSECKLNEFCGAGVKSTFAAVQR